MIAETLVGNGDRAFQYYDQVNPAAKNVSIDTYEIEPTCTRRTSWETSTRSSG